MSDALKKIESLAGNVAEKAAMTGTTLDEQIEVLKVLSPYYAALKKMAGKGDDEPDDDIPTMAAMQDELRRVERIENGSGEVSHRSRRRGN